MKLDFLLSILNLDFVSKNLENFKKFLTLKNEVLEEILIFTFFLVIFYLFFNLILKLSFNFIFKVNKKRGKLNLERIKTIIKIFQRFFFYLLVFIFLIFLLTSFNIKLTPLLTGAGFLGATLVLIFQNSLRDIFTGWILIFEDIFREGDFVVINDAFKGKVIDFKSRFIVLRGLQGEVILIPYSQINNIKNFTRYRLITKIILKLKKESWELLEKIENVLKNLNFEEEKRVSFLYLNKNFNLTNDQIEITIYYKIPYQYKDEILSNIKLNLIKQFGESIIEIRDEN